MKMLAHRYHAVPHGESHPVISISVLLTILFVGAHGVMFILFATSTSWTQDFIYQGANPFTVASVVIGILLLAFLAVDYRRSQIEGHGGNVAQTIAFGVAGVLLAMFLIFIFRVIRFDGLGS